LLTRLFFFAFVSFLSFFSHHARSPALAALFLLNNYHHVFRSAAKAGLALDRDLEARYLGKMREAQASYTAATWARVLMYLSVDDAPAILAQCKGSVVPDGTKPAIKRKFAGFNNTFDELYRTHRTYSIPDADLRAQVCHGPLSFCGYYNVTSPKLLTLCLRFFFPCSVNLR
jgi:hypothetical protein